MEVFDKIRAACAADEVEVYFERKRSALTRFSSNSIQQNGEEEGISISVRALHDGRTARMSGNKMDDESLERLAKNAYEAALRQPQNPDLLPMPAQQDYKSVDRFDAATAELTPQARAEAVKKVVARAESNRLTVAGVFASNEREETLMNSRGLVATHRETHAEFSVTYLNGGRGLPAEARGEGQAGLPAEARGKGQAGLPAEARGKGQAGLPAEARGKGQAGLPAEAGLSAQAGWAKGNFIAADNLDVEQLAESACRKAIANHEQKDIEPGNYTVILEPAAALDICGFMFYDFAGTAVQDKRSCFTDQAGKKVFGDNISVTDDVFHPLQSGSPWDGEGMPRQSVPLIEKGVLTNFVYARHTAKKMGAEATGHGFLLPNEHGEAPMNLVFAGGDTSTEEMIRSTDRGLLITRLWYIREVDPYEKILTGMTRDGTFLVENGKVKHAVRNLRFNQSLKVMLNNVEALGPAVRASGEESFDMVVPPMKVRDFRFTSVTKY